MRGDCAWNPLGAVFRLVGDIADLKRAAEGAVA